MHVQKLGTLLENATIPILKKLFTNWGYLVEIKPQVSGTQHGFDVYYKLQKGSFTFGVYVECKASYKETKIKVIELQEKINQFDWANFPQKDVHILFSPSKYIKYNNETTSIEDDNYPFIIMNWMNEKNSENLILDLFTTFDEQNEAVQEYKDQVLIETFPEAKFFPHSLTTFEEVSIKLKEKFDLRIQKYLGRNKKNNFYLANGVYWTEIKEDTDIETLPLFYTKADSRLKQVRQVVANDYHIKNELVEKEFSRNLKLACEEKFSLIKILSNGGEGKSTFLHSIAKEYYENNLVFWLEHLSINSLEKLENQIKYFGTKLPVIILIDNIAAKSDNLFNYTEKLQNSNIKNPIVFVIAERDFRYENIEDLKAFEGLFYGKHHISFKSYKIREKVFEKLIHHLALDNTISETSIIESRELFLQDKRKSLSERTFSVIKNLKEKNELQNYIFDWEDWEKTTTRKAPELLDLYLVVATFYQFGFGVGIDFSTQLLSEASFIKVNSFLNENNNLPIYKKGKHLFLRHETIASWYFEYKINRENSINIFQNFLANVKTVFARDMFIWVCLKSKDFKRSIFAKLVSDEVIEQTLKNYIEENKNELKSRTELSKIYQRQGKTKQAEDILLQLLELDVDNLQARTELSKIYQRQGKTKEAKELLQQCIKINPEDIKSLLELGRMYKKDSVIFSDADYVFSRILEIEPDDVYAKLELSRLHKKRRMFPQMRLLLIEINNVYPLNVPTLTELSYEFLRIKKPRIAIKLLEKALDIKPIDFITICELVANFKFLSDKKNVEKYYKKGEQIRKKYSSVKFSDRFDKLNPNIDSELELLELNKIGTLIEMNGNNYVECDEDVYFLNKNSRGDYHLKQGDKVFTGLYRYKEKTIASFAEPYFENIDDLKSILTIKT